MANETDGMLIRTKQLKQKKPGIAGLFLLCEAYLEVFIRINWNTIKTDLVVNMGTC